jgi:hypothetical protein
MIVVRDIEPFEPASRRGGRSLNVSMLRNRVSNQARIKAVIVANHSLLLRDWDKVKAAIDNERVYERSSTVDSFTRKHLPAWLSKRA